VLDTSLATKRQFQKLIELQLEDYPIALRSEVDDAYKMIHDLKKRVRLLEQKTK
jgi:polyhydroxyalkanoate synthesis regulator phasin